MEFLALRSAADNTVNNDIIGIIWRVCNSTCTLLHSQTQAVAVEATARDFLFFDLCLITPPAFDQFPLVCFPRQATARCWNTPKKLLCHRPLADLIISPWCVRSYYGRPLGFSFYKNDRPIIIISYPLTFQLFPRLRVATTGDRSVFSFFENGRPAHGADEIVARYQQISPNVKLSGPTSFAPLIHQAMRITMEVNPSLKP